MNSVVLIGRLTKDPEIKFIPATGLAVTRMILAVNKDLSSDKKQQAITQGKPTADFISVTLFGKQAESCTNYLSKGSMCAVLGRLSTGSYTTQSGEKRYTTDVLVSRIEFLGGSKNENQKKDVENEPFESVNDDNFVAANEVEIPF